MTLETGPPGLQFLARDLLSDPNDPRVGSGRDNSSGGTLSHATQSGSDSASANALGITLAPILIYSAICLAIFIAFRSRNPRVYAPKTLSNVRLPAEASPTLPSGLFNWIKAFYRIPDDEVLRTTSLDGFFFLRYIKLLATISAAGCICTWPILLPIHGTGTAGLSQLDILTIGNVKDPRVFMAHVVVAYIFFGFVLFTICRECIYWINLRQAYLLSAPHSQRLSSRTVLFTCVPRPLLRQSKIRKLFGPSVKTVWIPTDTNDLRRLVEEREQTSLRLEKAEIALIKLANAARNKAISKHMNALRSPRDAPSLLSARRWTGETGASGESRSVWDGKEEDVNTKTVRGSMSAPTSPVELQHRHATEEQDPDLYEHPYGLDPSLPDVRGSVAAQWIPVESRPTHRPIANYGRQVDTIRWTRLRIKALSVQIAKLRRQHRRGDGTPLNSVFVEFDTLANAQTAYQVLAHHLPLHMAPRFIGVKPDDVIWSSLRIKWWERIMRRLLMMGAITAAIIFWSIPSAIVGAISNIGFLAENVKFLSWVNDLPAAVKGVLQGLLPALALSALMAAVPYMLRACARVAGSPTKTQVELFTQEAYFVFQVVQVFLITTLTSAASAAFSKILEDPWSAKDLLSENLPKASNFYLSYILVQCLGRSAWSLAHIPELVRHQLNKRSQNPRFRFGAWHRLRRVHWGALFPVFSNMGVIAMSYACIAPLILIFSGLGMGCIYVAYRYNLVYSYTPEPDSEGLLYPRALTHLIVGIYMAQVCLIGLFALQISLPLPALFLMVVFLVFTIIVHFSLNDAIGPLLYNLPRTLALGGVQDFEYDDQDDALDTGDVFYDTDIEDPVGEPDPAGEMSTYATRGIEGGSTLVASLGQMAKSIFTSQVEKEAEASGLTRMLERARLWFAPGPGQPPNFFTRWLHPHVFEDFQAMQVKFGAAWMAPPQEVEYYQKYARDAYWPPEMWTPLPKLWIPRDEARVSRQEVSHTRKTIPIYDEGAWLDETGRVQMDLDKAPFDWPPVPYRAA
ncbi:DUF221-domain-containing protein [Thozetella sp. PMI_491]|nr:DUF221-domain-containing protein [Thozetella sp. PMI_491]